eukprot:3793107-Prorocentrum_lima.AAC.1
MARSALSMGGPAMSAKGPRNTSHLPCAAYACIRYKHLLQNVHSASPSRGRGCTQGAHWGRKDCI